MKLELFMWSPDMSLNLNLNDLFYTDSDYYQQDYWSSQGTDIDAEMVNPRNYGQAGQKQIWPGYRVAARRQGGGHVRQPKKLSPKARVHAWGYVPNTFRGNLRP